MVGRTADARSSNGTPLFNNYMVAWHISKGNTWCAA